MNKNDIILKLAEEKDIPLLKEKMEIAFSAGAIEQNGDFDNAPLAEELEIAFHSADCKVYCVLKDEAIVGGAVLKINEETQHNKMDIFFIFKEYQSKGWGLDAWYAIEREYPQTVVWELITPYFEKRNINFYINKCGFHIVEYFNRFHPDPLKPFPVDRIDDGFFRFNKEM